MARGPFRPETANRPALLQSSAVCSGILRRSLPFFVLRFVNHATIVREEGCGEGEAWGALGQNTGKKTCLSARAPSLATGQTEGKCHRDDRIEFGACGCDDEVL